MGALPLFVCNMEEKTPYITDELIAYLERMFPDRLPVVFNGEYDLGKRKGAVDVVLHLKALRDRQRENILEVK